MGMDDGRSGRTGDLAHYTLRFWFRQTLAHFAKLRHSILNHVSHHTTTSGHII